MVKDKLNRKLFKSIFNRIWYAGFWNYRFKRIFEIKDAVNQTIEEMRNENKIKGGFKDNELNVMKKLVSIAKPKLEDMHFYLEKELKSLNHV